MAEDRYQVVGTTVEDTKRNERVLYFTKRPAEMACRLLNEGRRKKHDFIWHDGEEVG